MKNNKVLFLIRGLPGAGKSTVAEFLDIDNLNQIYEADKYFIKDGIYQFDGSKIKEAHQWCKDQVEEDMKCFEEVFEGNTHDNTIVVSNTFSREWEMEDYFTLAGKYGYSVISLIVENRHNGENIHGVPKETIDKMRNRFEIKL